MDKLSSMFGGAPKFDPIKLKVNLKLGLTRVGLQKKKKANGIINAKRDVAVELGTTHNEDNARIKVEQIIKDDFLIEAFDILELLLEEVITKLKVLEASRVVPPELNEALSTLVYAAPRVQVPELQVIKDQLGLKFGKPFLQAANENLGGCVNASVLHKLTIMTPEPMLVYSYLNEIAQANGVDWHPDDLAASAEAEATASMTPPAALTATTTGSLLDKLPIPSFPSIPSNGGGLPAFPSVPGKQQQQTKMNDQTADPFPQTPAGGGLPAFPSVPGGGASMMTPKQQQPQMPSFPTPPQRPQQQQQQQTKQQTKEMPFDPFPPAPGQPSRTPTTTTTTANGYINQTIPNGYINAATATTPRQSVLSTLHQQQPPPPPPGYEGLSSDTAFPSVPTTSSAAVSIFPSSTTTTMNDDEQTTTATLMFPTVPKEDQYQQPPMPNIFKKAQQQQQQRSDTYIVPTNNNNDTYDDNLPQFPSVPSIKPNNSNNGGGGQSDFNTTMPSFPSVPGQSSADSTTSATVPEDLPDFDELTARFEALKKH